MKKITLYLVFVFIFSIMAYGETTADILNKIKAEYKSADKKITTMEMEQTITIMNDKDKIVTTSKMQKKNAKFRMEISIPMEEGNEPMKTVVLFDGTDVWSLLPVIGKQKLTGKDAEKYENQKDGQWWDDLEGMEYIGDEKVDGADCYVLSKKEKEVEIEKYWLNKSGLYPMKSENKIDDNVMTTIYSDIKTIEGYKMPCKYSTYEKENLVSEVQIKSISINKELSDDLFDPEKLKSDVNVQDMFKGMMPKF